MIDRDSASHRNHVAHVKILDVEKRYSPGPKHYVQILDIDRILNNRACSSGLYHSSDLG